MNKNLAQILAVRADALPTHIQGVTGFHQMPFEMMSLMLETRGWWAPRGHLETDPTFRQLIPYIILRNGDRFAVYKRGTAGGEARLHGKLSIGLGGHVDIEDLWMTGPLEEPTHTHVFQTLQFAIDRELEEEVTPIILSRDVDPAGLLIDNENDVGLVHLGIVYFVDVDDETASRLAPNEPEVCEIEWMTLEQLNAVADRLEGWTKIVLGIQ